MAILFRYIMYIYLYCGTCHVRKRFESCKILYNCRFNRFEIFGIVFGWPNLIIIYLPGLDLIIVSYHKYIHILLAWTVSAIPWVPVHPFLEYFFKIAIKGTSFFSLIIWYCLDDIMTKVPATYFSCFYFYLSPYYLPPFRYFFLALLTFWYSL